MNAHINPPGFDISETQGIVNAPSSKWLAVISADNFCVSGPFEG